MDLHLNWCIIYLDNIIIFSKTPREHIQRFRGVFKKLQQQDYDYNQISANSSAPDSPF